MEINIVDFQTLPYFAQTTPNSEPRVQVAKTLYEWLWILHAAIANAISFMKDTSEPSS